MLIDINQMVKIKVVDPPEQHRNYLEHEYHFLSEGSVVNNNPDVLVTFRDDLKMTGHNQIIVEPPVGYDGEGVFWFDPQHEMARIDFDNFDSKMTKLTVSRKFNVNFLHILILYLTSYKVMGHGGVFCHASAIEYQDKILLFPAWRHSGKTNLLLAFLENNGKLIADDGLILFNDGYFLPYSKRVHLLYFNLLAYPKLLNNVDLKIQNLFKFVENTHSGVYNITDTSIEQLKKMIRARVSFQDISGLEHNPELLSCDYVIHLNKIINPSKRTTSLNKIDVDTLATKATEETTFELTHFLSAYHVYKLTQSKCVPFLDNAQASIREIFKKCFAQSINFELSFSNALCDKEAKQMVVDQLYETQDYCYNTGTK